MYLIVHRSDEGKRQVITRERDWFMTIQAKKYYEGFHGKGYIFIDFIKWLNTTAPTTESGWCRGTPSRLKQWQLFQVKQLLSNWLTSTANNILIVTLTLFHVSNANWIHNHPGCCWNAWAICYSNSLATCKPYHLSLLRQNQINHERKVTMTPAFIHYIKSKHGRIKRIAKQYEHRKTKS